MSYPVHESGEIEVKAYPKRNSARRSVRPINKGPQTMVEIDNKGEDAKSVKTDVKPGKPSRKLPPKLIEDDDVEDGDIATPKRDRDDEQQDL